MTKPARWWQSFGAVAVLAGILGAISVVLAPIIYVIGMISIIGIPFAIAALIFPTICLWIVISYAVFRLKPLHTQFGILRSFLIALVIMVLVPQAYNLRVTEAVNRLQSGDLHMDLEPLQQNETLVVLGKSGRSSKCYNTCIDLLLSGQIAAYVAGGLPRGTTEPSGEMRVMRHRLVQSQDCSTENVLPKNASSDQNKLGTVAYQLNEASKRGICIQSTEMQLDNVGPMRAIAYIDRKYLDYPESLFFVDTQIRPSQIAVYQKWDGQDWRKISQKTNVSYSFLGPLLAHTIPTTTLTSAKSSWWRKQFSIKSLTLETFLVEDMGANLRAQ